MSRRRLYAWEIATAEAIFGDQIDYQNVWVYERVKFPNWIDNIGRWLRRMPARPKKQSNAVALGNGVFFPEILPKEHVHADDPHYYMHGWLLHELTHVWQYQQIGWHYLWLALKVQFEDGFQTYNYGGVYGLKKARELGYRFHDFDLEKQATIIQHYFDWLCRGNPVDAFIPYIEDIRCNAMQCSRYTALKKKPTDHVKII